MAADLYRALDDATGARGHLLDGLAMRHRRRPDGPARHALLDLRAGTPFVSAVVPFAQIRLDLGHAAIARQLAGFVRALQRAGQHQGEGPPREVASEFLRFPHPGRGEREVRASGVLPRQAPLGLPVTNQPDFRIGIVRVHDKAYPMERKSRDTAPFPNAAKPATPAMLVNVPRLIT